MERIEVRREGGREQAAAGLNRYLVAHFALERASALRVFAVHAAALLAVPAVVCLGLPTSHGVREVALGAFALAVCGTCLALTHELLCRRRLQRAKGGVRVVRE